MKKNVLILSQGRLVDLPRLEQQLLSRGFQTTRVSNPAEALFRAEHEVFSMLVCEDTADARLQIQLADGLGSRPFGATTPLLIIGPSAEPPSRSGLTSILDQYLQGPADPEMLADFVAETHRLRGEKAKRGPLASVSPPGLLYQAARLHLTGAVVLERKEEKCIVYFEEGAIAFASSNRDEHRFGDFLFRQGLVTREQLDRAADVHLRNGKRFGKTLVEEGFLKPQILTTLIQSQVKHIVFYMFDWNEGDYYILFDQRSGQEETVCRLDVPRMILEGVRLKFTESTLERIFTPFDQQASLTQPIEEIQRKLHLGRNETDFLRLLAKGRTVMDLMNLNSFSRLESLRLLHTFRILGMISFARTAVKSRPVSAAAMDRSRAVSELFEIKEPPTAPEGIRPPPTPPPSSAHAFSAPRHRSSKIAHMALGVLAFSLVLTIATLFEPHYLSRESQSLEQPARSLLLPAVDRKVAALKKAPAEAPPVTLSPTATPTPLSAERMESPTPVPTLDPFREMLAAGTKAERAGDSVRAVAYYRKALETRKEHPEATLKLANALFESGETQEAESLYREVSRIDPKRPEPHLALGTIARIARDNDRAAEHYRQYLNLVKETPQNQSRILEVRKILETLSPSR